MEHGHGLDFSIASLHNEATRMAALDRLIKEGHIVKKQLRKKILATELALAKLQGAIVPEDTDFSHPITVLRANLNWLRKQAPILKSSEEIIDEIEYVTKFLTNATND